MTEQTEQANKKEITGKDFVRSCKALHNGSASYEDFEIVVGVVRVCARKYNEDPSYGFEDVLKSMIDLVNHINLKANTPRQLRTQPWTSPFLTIPQQLTLNWFFFVFFQQYSGARNLNPLDDIEIDPYYLVKY